MKKPIYIDIFAGCGGLSLGLYNAGWQGLFAIEKNADAFKTLEYNLIKKTNHFLWPDWLPKTSHDINVVLKNYKEHLLTLQRKVDLVVGGPPCQGFSMAGRRMENDQRNTLIKSYIKFIRTIQPKIIFFEKAFLIKFMNIIECIYVCNDTLKNCFIIFIRKLKNLNLNFEILFLKHM